MNTPLLYKAYHEAGHAVTAHYFRRTVLKVSINPLLNLGNLVVSAAPAPASERMSVSKAPGRMWKQVQKDTLVSCKIAVSGAVAQSIFSQMPIDISDKSQDKLCLDNYLSSLESYVQLHPGFQLSERFKSENVISVLSEDVNQLFLHSGLWCYVDQLARELLCCSTLYRGCVQKVLESMPVDLTKRLYQFPPRYEQIPLEI